MPFDTEKNVVPQQPDQVKGAGEIKDPSLKGLTELVRTEAIRLHSSLNGVVPQNAWFYPEGSHEHADSFQIDVDKSIQVLEQALSEEPEIQIPEGREQEIFERSKKAVKQSIKAFVRNGDIPPALALTVGRFLRPSNIKIIPEDYARFVYFGHSFPTTPEERADLEVGIKYTFGHVDQYKEILEQNDVHLTDDQIVDLVLREGISHEYGHAVQRALDLMAWGDYIAKLPEGQRGDKYFWQFRDASSQKVYDTIAPNEDLFDLLKDEPEDNQYTERNGTSSERIGRGFQFMGVKYALQDFGIDSEKADIVVEVLKAKHGEILAEYKGLIQEIKSHDLNIALFSSAITDLLVALGKQDRKDLKQMIRFGFSVRELGYYYPLTPDQVRSFINELWLPDVTIDEKTNEQMDKAGGVTWVITND